LNEKNTRIDERLLQVSTTYAQQIGPEIYRSSVSSVKPWTPTETKRKPILPPQMLKLRDADIFIIEDRCKGCSYCIEFCPKDVLEEDKKLNRIGVHPPRVKDSTLCVGCGVCEDVCPDFAIYLIDKPRHEGAI
jgi:2-oxoglutarate ferredoxin oxidoreductase subunit delta